MQRTTRATIAALLFLAIHPAARPDEPADDRPPAVSPEVRASLDRISADSLRGHLSFLASDRLEGRGTPSRGLDLAAEYIAAQFRRAGLEPIGDDGYFQTTDWKYLAPDPETFECRWEAEGRAIAVDAAHASGALGAAIDLPTTTTTKVDAANAEAAAAPDPATIKGKVVLYTPPAADPANRTRGWGSSRARLSLLRAIEAHKPALVVEVDRNEEGATGLRRDATGRRSGRLLFGSTTARITVHSPRLASAIDALPAGPSAATFRLRVGEPKERTAKVRNVAGVLRGSDPERKSTYVIVSAHYDHLGIGPADGNGDRIFNGANDDASGTASVIEIASALATLRPRPRRSVLFLAFFGEEHGLVGSRYYVEHPLVPLSQTVADLNLEQVGRTDDSEGPRVSAANVTGFDYSDVGPLLRRAGHAVGVDVVKHATKSDGYFRASDNASFANVGIPAHTISVAYEFPDYHGADDEWEKIDYANMVRVDRMAALGLVLLADGPAPAWNASHRSGAAFQRRRAR